MSSFYNHMTTPEEKREVKIVEAADMWRSGDYVYMRLNGEEYMFSYKDIVLLPDLREKP